jgi:hypothetical protein
MTTPAEVIQSSRELDFETVDFGPDARLSVSERLTLVSEIAAHIHNAIPGTAEHAALVARYNTNLYGLTDWLSFRGMPLPDAATISDEWTLQEYLDRRADCEKNGPVTFRAFWNSCHTVSHVKIKRRVWFASPTKYTVQTLRCFKGTLAPIAKFSSCQWIAYKKGAEYLIWLSEYGALGNPMRIQESAGRMVAQQGNSVAFFQPARSRITDDYTAETPLDEVIEVLESFKRHMDQA